MQYLLHNIIYRAVPLLHWTYHGYTAYCVIPEFDIVFLSISENFGLYTYFWKKMTFLVVEESSRVGCNAFETSLTIHQSTRFNVSIDMNLQRHCCETLKSVLKVVSVLVHHVLTFHFKSFITLCLFSLCKHIPLHDRRDKSSWPVAEVEKVWPLYSCIKNVKIGLFP